MNDMDGRAQMTWNQLSTKVYTLFEHGMGNSLLIEFLDKSYAQVTVIILT